MLGTQENEEKHNVTVIQLGEAQRNRNPVLRKSARCNVVRRSHLAFGKEFFVQADTRVASTRGCQPELLPQGEVLR